MRPRPLSPTTTADQNAEHQQQEPDRAATPPPPNDIYATLAGTLASPWTPSSTNNLSTESSQRTTRPSRG